MEKYGVTKHGFRLFSTDDLAGLMRDAGFRDLRVDREDPQHWYDQVTVLGTRQPPLMPFLRALSATLVSFVVRPASLCVNGPQRFRDDRARTRYFSTQATPPRPKPGNR
jgi:hypothetical protein